MNKMEKEILERKITRLKVDLELVAKSLDEINEQIDLGESLSNELAIYSQNNWDACQLLETINRRLESYEITSHDSLYA